MAGYTKEFLIDAFISRYTILKQDKLVDLRALATQCYDLHGKDKFRVYASLDADAIKQYKQILKVSQ
jgi:hypothetical protein